MSTSWHKFFSQRAHAENFLDGNLLFRPLTYFRDLDEGPANKEVIGDKYEGKRAWVPPGGVIITDHFTSEIVGQFEGPFEFSALLDAEEIYVLCVSNCYNDILAHGFGAQACVSIRKKRAFISRLRSVLPPDAKLVSGAVEYCDYASEEHVRTLFSTSQERIVLSKRISFSYQKEYRFAFSTTGALDPGKGAICMTEFSPARDPERPREHWLHVGSLRDICVLRDCA